MSEPEKRPAESDLGDALGGREHSAEAGGAADIMAYALDTFASTGGHAYQADTGVQACWQALQAWKARPGKKISLTPNPWFVQNGIFDESSPVTEQYLRTRALKNFFGSAINFGGAVASIKTVVNAGGAAVNANAAAATVLHLRQLRAMAKEFPDTGIVGHWLELMIRWKVAKGGTRVLQASGSLIPVPLASFIVSLLAAASTLSLKVTERTVCAFTAMELHWRAYGEQGRNTRRADRVFGGVGGFPVPAGSRHATRIFEEIMHRRGAMRLMGQYDVPSIIKEPAGWMALSDKLMLF
jgi:hypothetical protein